MAYVIQIYMYYITFFLDFEKFKVYGEFKILKNNLNGLSEPLKIRSEPEPKFINTRMRLKTLTLKIQNPNRPKPNPNEYPNAHPYQKLYICNKQYYSFFMYTSGFPGLRPGSDKYIYR